MAMQMAFPNSVLQPARFLRYSSLTTEILGSPSFLSGIPVRIRPSLSALARSTYALSTASRVSVAFSSAVTCFLARVSSEPSPELGCGLRDLRVPSSRHSACSSDIYSSYFKCVILVRISDYRTACTHSLIRSLLEAQSRV